MSLQKRARKTKYPVLRLAIFFIGCVFGTGLTIYSIVQHIQLAFDGIKTNATVVHIEQSGRTRTQTFRITTEAGRVIDVIDDISGAGRREVGETVPIVYLPSNPKIFVVQGIYGYTNMFIFFIITLLMFMGFLSAGMELRMKGLKSNDNC